MPGFNDPNYYWDGKQWVPKASAPGAGSDPNSHIIMTNDTTTLAPTIDGLANTLQGPGGDPTTFGVTSLRNSGAPDQIAGLSPLQAEAAKKNLAATYQNPYNMALANRSRDAYINAARAASAGPSAVGLQANKSMSALGRNVAAAQGSARSPLAQMLAARAGGQAGAALASQAAGARGMEEGQRLGALGNAYVGLRRQDLKNMKADADSGLATRDMNRQISDFYRSQQLGMEDADARNSLENDKLLQRVIQGKQKSNNKDLDTAAQVVGTFLKMLMGGM